jgi:hypothetical protein
MRHPALLLGILFVASCSRPGSLEGTWDIGGAEVSWPGSTATITFSPTNESSGRLSAVFEGPQNFNGINVTQSFRCEGTYDLRGDTLDLAYTDVEGGIEGVDANVEKLYIEFFDQQKEQFLASINSVQDGKIKWKNQDTFEYRTDVVATFRRQSP